MICEMIWDPSWILKLYLYQRINSPCPEISIRSVNNKPVTTATRIPSVFSKSDIFLNGGKEVIHGLITTGIYYEVCQTTKRQYNFLASAESHRSATNRRRKYVSTGPGILIYWKLPLSWRKWALASSVPCRDTKSRYEGGQTRNNFAFPSIFDSIFHSCTLFITSTCTWFRFVVTKESIEREREREGANAARIKRKRRGGGKGRAIFIRYVQFSQSRRGNFLLLRLYYIRFLLLRARVMLDNGVWNNRAERRAPCVKRVRMGKKGRDKKIFTLLFFIPLLRTALPFLPALPTKRRKMILEIRGRVKKWFFADV